MIVGTRSRCSYAKTVQGKTKIVMRPIKELLILVRNRLSEFIEEEGCICFAVAEMYPTIFSLSEANFIVDYIRDHRPDDATGWAFFWPRGELAPRLEFLNKLIDEL